MKPIWRMGFYGGVFDPPHNSHADCIRLVQKEYNFDHLLAYVCHTPCHKHPPIASYEQRMIMTQYMVDYDIKIKPYVGATGDYNLPRPSYTVNYIQNIYDILNKHFKLEISLIMGSDEWNNFPSWHEVERLYDLCENIIVLQRMGYVVKNYDEFKCEVVENDIPSISSTQIREMIKSGQDVSDFLPLLVKGYIEWNGLYI